MRRQLEKEKLGSLLEEESILQRVKIESLVLPSLELRRVSQVTIPAELPGGSEMGEIIDGRIKPQVLKLQEIGDMRAKVALIQIIKKNMESLFEEVVEGSKPYKSLYKWSDELSLKSEQSSVRPTVHEIYIFKDPKTKRELSRLLNDRKKIRGKTQKRPDPNMDRMQFAYPEEFESKWITGMGRLLGYPDCCVKRYAEDRENGVNVEVRAAKQLKDRLEAKETIDIHAYPLCFFFPCEPDCEKSISLGRHWSETLKETDSRLGANYDETLRNNIDMVLHQPEIIARHFSQLNV